MKYIDLCAGTGAFSYVLNGRGHECVFANDMLPSSKSIYNLNFPEHHLTLEDLTSIDVSTIPSHDLLCGGFPCQPFSIAGAQRGFDDRRSNVFWKITDILKYHKPEYLLLENVKNLMSHDKGRTFEVIRNSLNECGYNIKWCVLDTAKHTSVPHHRERVYIAGFREANKCRDFSFDFADVALRDVKDFLMDDIPDKYYYSDRYDCFSLLQEEMTKKYTFYQFRRHYVRENKSGVCPTLTANMGSGGHNVPLIVDERGIRKLTPRECFNLQGFPSDYLLPNLSDSKLYSLAGNAVSIPIVEGVVENMFLET